MNNSESVKGFKISNTQNETKCIQHANDSTFPVKDMGSLEHVVKIVDNFGYVSGTKLNISKTECIPLEVLKHTMEVEITLKGMKIILKQFNVLTLGEVEN